VFVLILLGFEHIPYPKIEKIDAIKDIESTSANSVVYFNYKQELLNYCFENSVPYAVKIDSILQALYSHNLGAQYIIVEDELVVKVQDLADHYLFDSKIIVPIQSVDQIESKAIQHIDGVINTKILG
jgi:hypothetical protein